jgi:hypothetical protein
LRTRAAPHGIDHQFFSSTSALTGIGTYRHLSAKASKHSWPQLYGGAPRARIFDRNRNDTQPTLDNYIRLSVAR